MWVRDHTLGNPLGGLSTGRPWLPALHSRPCHGAPRSPQQCWHRDRGPQLCSVHGPMRVGRGCNSVLSYGDRVSLCSLPWHRWRSIPLRTWPRALKCGGRRGKYHPGDRRVAGTLSPAFLLGSSSTPSLGAPVAPWQTVALLSCRSSESAAAVKPILRSQCRHWGRGGGAPVCEAWLLQWDRHCSGPILCQRRKP